VPPLAIKGEACKRFRGGSTGTQTHLDPAQAHKFIQALKLNTSYSGVGYYAPAARTTLNPCMFLSSSFIYRQAKHLSPCWGEGEDATLRSRPSPYSLHQWWQDSGRHTLRLIRGRMKTCDEVISSCDLVQNGGPRVIWPIVTGPAWPLRVTGLICKGLPVVTVCNPALWEYSSDNLGV
jgi:hypothetical protein